MGEGVQYKTRGGHRRAADGGAGRACARPQVPTASAALLPLNVTVAISDGAADAAAAPVAMEVE